MGKSEEQFPKDIGQLLANSFSYVSGESVGHLLATCC